MSGHVELRAVPNGDTERLFQGVNILIALLSGTSGGQLRMRGFDGVRVDVLTGATISSTNYPLDVAGAGGLHQIWPLAATTAQPTLLNSAAAVHDTGFVSGVNRSFRAMSTGGTNYVDLKSDANGGLTLTGVGPNAGTIQGLASLALTSFLSIGATPATTGAIRLANAASAYFRNAANSADLALIGSDASNNVVLGDASAAAVKALVPLRLVDGSASAPAWGFTTDTDTGLYRVTTSTGRIGVTCDGTQVAEFVNNGSTLGFGLGTAPSTILTVARNVADYLGTFTNANSRGLGVTISTGGTNAADRLLGLFSNTSTDRFSVFADGTITAGGVALTPALGSWTPALASTGTTTYTTQTGNYIKIGRLVIAWCQLQINTKDGAASASSITLPFTADNNASGVVDTWGTLSSSVDQIGVVTSGANAVLVGTTGPATASGTLSVLQSGSLVRFQVTYRTAS